MIPSSSSSSRSSCTPYGAVEEEPSVGEKRPSSSISSSSSSAGLSTFEPAQQTVADGPVSTAASVGIRRSQGKEPSRKRQRVGGSEVGVEELGARAGAVSNSALQVFSDCQFQVEEEQGYVEAIAAANAGIRDKNSWIRAKAVDVFKALVEKGQGYAEAIAAASRGIKDRCKGVRSPALDLFQSLFEKGQGYGEAIAAASAGIRDEKWRVRNSALNVFQALVEKGQGYGEAIAAASAGIGYENWKVRKSALGVFEALVEKGQGYVEAIAAARAGIRDKEWQVSSPAVSLFQSLFEKNQGFDRVTEIGFYKNGSVNKSESILDLFCLLARYTHGIEAAKIYQGGLKGLLGQFRVGGASLGRLTAAIERGDGFEPKSLLPLIMSYLPARV